jgi:uroporphyrinogen-III synthase
MADTPNGRLLHLHGADTRGDVAERLVSAGIETVSLTIYRQDPELLTPEAAALLASAGPVILPLFSPRSATLFRRAMPLNSQASLHIVAMSAAVAEAARAIPYRALILAPGLTADAMLDACGMALGAAAPP